MNTQHELDRYRELLVQLNARQIRPSKIIGTGYKQPRVEALRYLAERIEQLTAQL